MPPLPCEILLSRILTYVAATGVEINRAITIAALKLVEAALAQDSEEPYVFAMDRLPLQLPLPETTLPPLSPPIRRGSIGYRKP